MDLYKYFLALDMASWGCYCFLSDNRFSYRMVHRDPDRTKPYDLVILDYNSLLGELADPYNFNEISYSGQWSD